MKKTPFLLAFSISLSSLYSMAQHRIRTLGTEITCDDAQSIGSPNVSGSVYTFTVQMKCHANAEIPMAQVKNRLFEKFSQNEVHSVKESIYHKGLPGSQIEFTENLELDHGNISTRFRLFIVGNEEKVEIDAKSISIEATGNARLTKAVKLEMSANNTSSRSHFSITKTASVKKPWLAPEFIFTSSAIKGIKKDLRRLSKQYLGDRS